jgi:NAD(P)-dependent dehydrogenase (short-subunit alcohol dehydrogenase family)
MHSPHLPSFDLTDQIVLVTGASRGIGRGLAEALAAAGAVVAVSARRLDDAAEVAADITAGGGRATAHSIDVADVGSIQRGVAAVVAQHGRLDVLVANAGLGANHAAVDVTEEDWDEMMGVNARGLFFSAQAAGRVMLAQGRGRIIAVSSQASVVGIRDHAVYCASKGAVNQLVRVLGLEWGAAGVTVNAVAPTFIYTPGTAERLDDPTYLDGVLARIPMRQVGRIADVAGAVMYLASDAAALVNGTVLMVDGGWTAQ